jgi:hypothetical protein
LIRGKHPDEHPSIGLMLPQYLRGNAALRQHAASLRHPACRHSSCGLSIPARRGAPNGAAPTGGARRHGVDCRREADGMRRRVMPDALLRTAFPSTDSGWTELDAFPQ